MADEVSSTPAVSAPAVSTSAPSATPAPAVSAPASSSASPATPTAPEATATPAAAIPAPRPARSDFEATREGMQAFLRAENAWEDATGEEDGVPAATAQAPEVPGDPVPEPTVNLDDWGDPLPEKAADPAAEPKPEEVETEQTENGEQAAGKEEQGSDLTPEALAGLIDSNPARKAMLDADPEFKGKIFAMARQNAKATPMLDLFPNVEAAKFANDSANTYVGMKTAFELSDSPEKMAEAAGQFLEQFAIVDEKGNPVLDQKGNPTYGDDLELFVDHIKTRDRGTRIAHLRSRVDAGQYASEQAKENDEQLLAAYEFIDAAEKAGPADPSRPDTSQMSPEARAYFEKREQELEAERERLGLKDKTLTKKATAETRAKYDQQYRQEFGASTGRYIGNYLKQKNDEGVVIPQYMLTMTDPKTGISVFAQNAFQRLNEKLKATPTFTATSATMQMNAINDQGLKARLAFAQGEIDQHLPGILDEMLFEAGVSLKQDAQRREAQRDARRTTARVEPAAGAPSTPQGMTAQQLQALATANVDKKFSGNLTPGKRIAEISKEFDRLEAAR